MNITLKLALLALISFASAQTEAAGPTTNLVQNINLKLTVYTEEDTTTNGSVVTTPVLKLSRSTKDIIQLLGEATTNAFSPSAKLVLVSPLEDGDSSIIVQDGATQVDVSDFFSYDQTSSGDVHGSISNTVSKVEKETDYNIVEFSMHDHGAFKLGAHFDAAGLATVKSSTIVKSGTVLGKSHQVAANLAGEGDFTDDLGTHYIIVQVSITITGNTVVVTP